MRFINLSIGGNFFINLENVSCIREKYDKQGIICDGKYYEIRTIDGEDYIIADEDDIEALEKYLEKNSQKLN